jgi:uncharacterized peroxidase-related enzyme
MNASGQARELLDAVQLRLGATPNFIRVLANAPQALQGFLGLYAALGSSSFDEATRERIALAVAEVNACQYCLSAHTAIGRHAGLSNEEMLLNRRGTSTDAKAAAAVAFARALSENAGEIDDATFARTRASGLTDAEIVEVIAIVALNIFTNLLGKATRVEIDFPRVAALAKAKHAA